MSSLKMLLATWLPFHSTPLLASSLRTRGFGRSNRRVVQRFASGAFGIRLTDPCLARSDPTEGPSHGGHAQRCWFLVSFRPTGGGSWRVWQPVAATASGLAEAAPWFPSLNKHQDRSSHIQAAKGSDVKPGSTLRVLIPNERGVSDQQQHHLD